MIVLFYRHQPSCLFRLLYLLKQFLTIIPTQQYLEIKYDCLQITPIILEWNLNIHTNKILVLIMSFEACSAKYLTRNQVQQVEKSFKIFDQDGSGSISIRQFDQILKSLGQNLPQQQLQFLIQAIDKDGNGFIEFQQFLQLVAPKIIANRSQKDYIQTFRIIDENNDGAIDKKQLMRANQIAGQPLSQAQIDQIIQFVSLKYENNFNIETVFKMMLRQPILKQIEEE